MAGNGKQLSAAGEPPPLLLPKTATSTLAALGNPAEWFTHIVIVRSQIKREYFPTEQAFLAEQECIPRSEEMCDAIVNLGIRCSIVEAGVELSDELVRLKPDLCINFADSVRGSLSLAAGIPGLFELLNIPYVGANTLALSLNANKYLTKSLLEAWELPTPQYQLMREETQELDYDLRFPLILKLNEEHGGVGCSENSVVTNEIEFRKQLEYLMKTYKQEVLVEEFIEDGRELTALVLESQRLNTYISERSYQPLTKRFKLLTFETTYAAELGGVDTIVHKQYIDKDDKIRADVKKAFEILKMDDLGRFDIMLDKYGNHYIIDCNANPSFGPKEAVASVAKVNDHPFQEVLTRVLKRNYLDLLVPGA